MKGLQSRYYRHSLEIRVVMVRLAGVPCVPEAAVRWEGSRAVVEVLEQEGEDGGVREVEVELGPLVDGVYPVLGGGVKRGERVVLR